MPNTGDSADNEHPNSKRQTGSARGKITSSDSCCDVRLLIARSATGRRIYVQEESFAHLAAKSEELALLVYGILSRIAVVRAVYHHVQMDAIEFGTGEISDKRASQIVDALARNWSQPMTESLRTLGYYHRSGPYSGDFHPLLQSDESVVATCYFSNYYTFATGIEAAERMYSDTNDIGTIRRLKEETDLYEQLELISGHCLAPIDPSVGVGKNKAGSYRSFFNRITALDSTMLHDIRLIVYRDVCRELENLFEGGAPHPSEAEAEVFSRIRRSVASAFSFGVLKIVDRAM